VKVAMMGRLKPGRRITVLRLKRTLAAVVVVGNGMVWSAKRPSASTVRDVRAGT